jgi:hypothetical protein
MASVSNSKGEFTVIAYAGDAKTLLAFNLDKESARNLAGFTIYQGWYTRASRPSWVSTPTR